MASIQCRCGNVHVRFATTEPVWQFECLCVDCYDKNMWSCRACGVDAPSVLETHGTGKGCDLRYWPNKMTVTGKEHLKFMRLREGARSTNMIADCCKTVLCCDNPFYKGSIFLTWPEYLPEAGVPELDPPRMRVQPQDWTEEEFAKLSPKLSLREGYRTKEADECLNEFIKICTETPVTEDMAGDSFQDLLAAAGGDIITLGLPENKNSYSLRVREGRA